MTYLDEPLIDIKTDSRDDGRRKVISASLQGWRKNMEDQHIHLLEAPDDKEACFFAVYDGHGGAKVAQYAGNHLHSTIMQTVEYASGNIEEALRQGFLKLDQDMAKDEEIKEESSGSTAIVVIFKGEKLYCANVGDSRAIASCGGVAVELSQDHKPTNVDEARRIIAGGGFIESHRVNGNLALSRALGDFTYKQDKHKSPKDQIVTAFPDVITRGIEDDVEFVIMACDGVWDVWTNQEAVDFCRVLLSFGISPEKICQDILKRCVAPSMTSWNGLGLDNATVVLVLLQHKGFETLREKCAKPRLPTTRIGIITLEERDASACSITTDEPPSTVDIEMTQEEMDLKTPPPTLSPDSKVQPIELLYGLFVSESDVSDEELSEHKYDNIIGADMDELTLSDVRVSICEIEVVRQHYKRPKKQKRQVLIVGKAAAAMAVGYIMFARGKSFTYAQNFVGYKMGSSVIDHTDKLKDVEAEEIVKKGEEFIAAMRRKQAYNLLLVAHDTTDMDTDMKVQEAKLEEMEKMMTTSGGGGGGGEEGEENNDGSGSDRL